jgi:hypothetical protein
VGLAGKIVALDLADGEAVGGTGVEDGRVDGEGVEDGRVDGEAVGPLPAQATPFNVKTVGLAFDPL